MVDDQDAGVDALYGKKIVYDPTSMIATATSTNRVPVSSHREAKIFDWGRIQRLCRITS